MPNDMPTKEELKCAADAVNEANAEREYKEERKRKKTRDKRFTARAEDAAKGLGDKMRAAASEGSLSCKIDSAAGDGADDDMWKMQHLLRKRFPEYDWTVSTHEGCMDFPKMSSLYVRWDDE